MNRIHFRRNRGLRAAFVCAVVPGAVALGCGGEASETRPDEGAATGATSSTSGAPATASIGQSSPFGARLSAFVEQALELGVAPGMSIAVVRGDETLFSGGFGLADVETGRPVDAETIFYIASSTKSFTGLAAAILHERGELDLDASLATYLPDVRLADGLDPNAITLRDLLTHTHGIGNSGPVVFRLAFSGVHTHDGLIDQLSLHPPAESGREFRYGNIGYNVAGLAMDEYLGTPWKDVLQTEIFGPLGMRSTSAYRSRLDEDRLAMPYGLGPEGLERLHYGKDDGNMHSAGGMMTTAADAARWLRVQLTGGRLGGEQILDPEAIAESHRPQADEDDSFMSFTRTGYGLGWHSGEYDGRPFTHHFGGFSGFHAHVSFMPEDGLGVAILVNSGSGAPLADLVSRYAYDVLREVPDVEEKYARELEGGPGQLAAALERIRADRDRRAARPQELPRPLEAYTGVFENEGVGRLELELVDGRLEASMGVAWSEVEVYDNEEEQLRVELTGGGTVVQVEFDPGSERADRLRALGFEFERVGN